jgi:hypothetical protein
MFSFFKKKTILNNDASRDLALMLYLDKDTPIPNVEFFEAVDMDLSLGSLLILDEYLESLRSDPPEDEALVRLVLRAGSYIGEVIRKNSAIQYDWLEYHEAKKISQSVKGLGLQLGTVSMIWSKPDSFVFPLAKVMKRLTNGHEDSVHSFAKVIISGVPSEN